MVNHEYEDNSPHLSEFFRLLTEETPALMGYAEQLIAHCRKHYPTA